MYLELSTPLLPYKTTKIKFNTRLTNRMRLSK